MNRDDQFEKFYRDGEYAKWDPDSSFVSRKTVLRAIWEGGWSIGYKEGREELAAKLCRDLHQHMGKKTVLIMD